MAVLASGLCCSYFWALWTVSPLCPPCPSPPIFFTALFPLLSTDLSTKCFPSLLAIFIPLSELFPLVNSFLAWVWVGGGGWVAQLRRQLVLQGRRCRAGGPLGEGNAEPHGPGLAFGDSFLLCWQCSSSSKMLIHSPFQFVKTIL